MKAFKLLLRNLHVKGQEPAGQGNVWHHYLDTAFWVPSSLASFQSRSLLKLVVCSMWLQRPLPCFGLKVLASTFILIEQLRSGIFSLVLSCIFEIVFNISTIFAQSFAFVSEVGRNSTPGKRWEYEARFEFPSVCLRRFRYPVTWRHVNW
jgi:hypothetical protein